MAEIFVNSGQITEEEFDEAGIMRIENQGKEKEQLVLMRQRSVLITLEASLKRRAEYCARRKAEIEAPAIRKRIR